MEKLVLGYVRYSSENQQMTSIEAQKHIITKYCEVNNIAIDGFIEDPEVSGQTPDRPGLQELKKLMEEGKVESVVVHKRDRLHRNLELSIVLEKLFKDHNVKLIVVDGDSDNTTAQGKLFSLFQDLYAQYYVENLSEEVRKGTHANARKGLVNGGSAPFGYKFNSEKKTYTKHEKEAEIVKEIFSLYIAGNGYEKIINTLSAMDYSTRSGKDFSKSTLSTILKNEVYIGTLKYNKTSQSRTWDGQSFKSKTITKKNSAEEVIVVEDAFEAIIDKETFFRVQETLNVKNNNQANNQKSTAKNLYLLTNLLYCGVCGSKMTGNASYGKNDNKNYYYACNCKKNKKACNPLKKIIDEKGSRYELDKSRTIMCNSKSIKKEMVEDMALSAIIDRYFSMASDTNEFFDSSLTKDIASEVNAVITGDKKELKTRQKYINRNIKAMKNNLKNHISEGNLNSINILEEELNMVNNELQYITAAIKATKTITYEGVVEIMQAQLKNYMIIDEYRESKKGVLSALIDKVIVFDNYIEIHYPDFSDNGQQLVTVVQKA